MKHRIILVLVAGSVASGCSGSAAHESTARNGAKDPRTVAGDQSESPGVRANAVRDLWASAQGKSDQEINAAREEMKKVVWRGGAPQAAREAAIECLLSDVRSGQPADTANMLRLRLPTEPNYGVLKYTCGQIAARAGDPIWRATTTGLVRSWSRKLPSPPDDARPEREALAALFPERAVEDTVFAVFMDPVSFGASPDATATSAKNEDSGPLGIGALAPDSAKRIRQSAWDLLGRIDPRGERRAGLLSGVTDTHADATLDALVKTARDLRVVPITGSELAWAEDLQTSKNSEDAAWWAAASSAAAGLGESQRAGLQMRHLDSVRWAAERKPAWLSMDRAALLDTLAERLKGRRTYRVGQSEGVDFAQDHNRLQDWEEQVVWGDLLCMLVVDEAMFEPGVRRELFKQAQTDRADSSAEWGGCLFDVRQLAGSGASKHDDAGLFAVMSFPARPAQRINDRTFVAADGMFGVGVGGGVGGARSLAHYHFHAQSQTNQQYAGPGSGDREYADLHNRNCLVFTPVREGLMNVDYYQRGGATIDLGEIVEPGSSASR